MGGSAAMAEQATVRRWAWRSFRVVVRPAPDGWPPSVDALAVRCGDPGVTARILYRPDAPHWRAGVMRELAALVDAARAG